MVRYQRKTRGLDRKSAHTKKGPRQHKEGRVRERKRSWAVG